MAGKAPNHPLQEEEVLAYWQQNQCFEKSVSQRPEEKPYVFYDGPPFATGLPHYGHIVASVMKDVVPRFWTMKGYRVDRTWGWDCHGLPIENIVEKKFDLNSKADIEQLGVDVFNEKCHAEVMKYAEEWKTVIHRLGRWVDMENAYKTMDLPFMESLWWVFKALWEKGLIFEGYKSLHICPRCETVLSKFEVNEGYVDVKDLSVVAKFRLTSGKYKDAYVLAWTTTPWTLPGNVLLAVGKQIEYVLVSIEQEDVLLAKERVEEVCKGLAYTVKETVDVNDVLGSTYEPLFPYFADHQNAFRVVVGDFVTTDEGTGVVHIAPGFGEDDKVLGEKEGVAPIMHVRMNGMFVDEVAKPLAEEGYAVEGVPVKQKGDTMSVDIEIVKALAHHGKLFSKQKFEHSYPLCWRCDTPLINYATTSWFVGVSGMVEELVRGAKDIRWVPGNIKEGRFGNGLAASPDWSISRSRYWGTPLPIWRAEDGELLVIGSLQELEDLSGTKVENLHKQIVDQIVIVKDGKTYTRVPEVLDCWFESGSMPYAQKHYPFENKETFEKGFPAEFIAEGIDQTSLWFHKLHVVAMSLFGKPAYKNVVVNGIVLAEDGKKMSKKLRNYPDPMDVMQRYGSDAVRYYLMSSPVVRAENLCFSEKEVADVSRKFVTILRNVDAFYQLYRGHDDARVPQGKQVLDRWVLARLHETLKEETEALEAYDLQTAARTLQTFVSDVSQWYVRRSRDRMKTEGEDRAEALATLRTVLETFSKMIAPFTPFLAELVYQHVEGDFSSREDRLSVHLEDWPLVENDRIDTAVLEQMAEAREIVSLALERRADAGVNVRQPLAGMTLWLPSGMLDDALIEVIKDEVNVKHVLVQTGERTVELDLEVSPALKREGIARELIRRVNALRKEAGLTIDDRIVLSITSASEEVQTALQEHETALLEGTLSLRLETDVSFEGAEGFDVNGISVSIGLKKDEGI